MSIIKLEMDAVLGQSWSWLMEFSLLNAVRNHPDAPYPLRDVYADYIDDAVRAEGMDFVRSWYGEHHFRACQWSASPVQLAVAVASRTERMRVGTAVTLMPFHDPRRLAEDVATADIISRGRFDFGIGPGSQYEEFRSFGIDPKEMFGRTWESIDWIRRAFASESEFTHEGRYYTIPEMTFTTKPVQEPVPVWYGATGRKSAARAAERGFNLIGAYNPNLISPHSLGYDELLRSAGRNPADYKVASMQMICVADTAQQAWDASGRGLEYFVNFYAQRKNLQGEPADPAARITIDMLQSGKAGIWRTAVGTPDDVIAALAPLVQGKGGRVTELACAFRHAGMRNPEVERSMKLFAAHVMPALRELAIEQPEDG
jgi:alkanesulfonate monooxygenase SsuD/methylene tetrahydromethanopterin reductase-like flavin-dependent oxidoreductase (luciferase family)